MAAAATALASAEKTIGENDAEIAALVANLFVAKADLQTALAQLDAAVKSLQEKDAEVAALTAGLAAAHADLQAASAQRDETVAKLIEQDARIATLEDDLEQARALAQDSASALDEAANQLKEREQEIDALEGDLEDSQAAVEAKSAELEQNRMKPVDEPEIMRVHEPMGFYVDPYDTATGNRLLTAIACVGGMPPGYEPHVYYRIYDQGFIDTLVRSDDYKKVGEAKYSSADWTSEEVDIEFFYTRKETLDSHPYQWLEDKDWVTNEMAWFATLQAYCGDTVSQ
ncbi:MAG: hypothetical protein F4X02_11520 [Chloroflexi bacterium]|nr:hypothetical protein [Chloroflexota bacterium]